jgi:two-component system response regulator HydG
VAKNILIIDDEELVAQSLKRLLKKEGFTVTIASSGQEAAVKVKEADFGLIICDVRMPDMDGTETIKRIREYLKKSDKKPIPEILISGYADSSKYEEAQELGVVEYLYKPFDNAEFLRVVKKTMP